MFEEYPVGSVPSDIEVLNRVYHLIESGISTHICHAIYRLFVSPADSKRLIGWIQGMVGINRTAVCFLLANGISEKWVITSNMKEYRLLWIKHIIKFCEDEDNKIVDENLESWYTSYIN